MEGSFVAFEEGAECESCDCSEWKGEGLIGEDESEVEVTDGSFFDGFECMEDFALRGVVLRLCHFQQVQQLPQLL